MKTDTITRANDHLGTFSERFPVLYDMDGRQKKADKVLAVCAHFSFRPLEELVCLDLGASAGIMTERFAENFRRVIALDIDRVGLHTGYQNSRRENIDYICSDGTDCALADNSVDVVICNQIYEHVDDQEGLMSEIYRVLKYDGFCYFGAGNRYVIIEGHYFLPFLSWFPRWVSNIYMVLAGKRGRYDVRLLSLRKLRMLLGNFWRHDYTRMIFEEPEAFHADDIIKPNNIMARLPRRLFTALYPFFPAWVWILTKRK